MKSSPSGDCSKCNTIVTLNTYSSIEDRGKRGIGSVGTIGDFGPSMSFNLASKDITKDFESFFTRAIESKFYDADMKSDPKKIKEFLNKKRSNLQSGSGKENNEGLFIPKKQLELWRKYDL